MAASSTLAPGRLEQTATHTTSSPTPWTHQTWQGILLLLTSTTLLIQGYHPFSEDGGLYAAGIEYLIDPTLFPHDTSFITAHLHYSLFAFMLAFIASATHLALPYLIFTAYLASLCLTLYAALRILQRCHLSPVAQLMGLAMLSAWATLPVAGTSLVLLDPYLTARSISTPLSLLAIGFALDDWKNRRSWYQCSLFLALAALMHPLMATYAIALVIAIRCMRSPRWIKFSATLVGLAIALAALLRAFAPSESPAVVQAAISRYYWFLSQWQWFEFLGLAGPLIVLYWLRRSARRNANTAIEQLCSASLLIGSIAIVIALFFAQQNAPAHLVARLQPLRVFLLIYALMTILLTATLTQTLVNRRLSHSRRSVMLTVAFLTNAVILFAAQRAIYPASQHLELPWSAPTNPWSQAFVWARSNTPKDALFALDANYITQSGEDAQTFRATAQRSALPDFSKDGGEAAITPSLASLWQQGVAAQTALSRIDDATRRSRLLPLGVTWMVLRNDAVTQDPCPYRNATVKVCRLIP